MEIRDLLKKPVPEIPPEIAEKLNAPQITLTPLSDADIILSNRSLQQEIGYRQFETGDWLVSMNCPMPGITPEMIAWWFWWHPQETLRYQIWFPGDHFSITYAKKNKAYFEQKSLPPFQPNSQLPTERIAGIPMPLRIDFLTPEEFGFSRQALNENDIPIVVCGHVSAFNGMVKHTEMAHVFHQTEDGLFMTSRFWLGKTSRNPLLRKTILTEKTARGMAEHCCVEYRNLTEILPALYREYANKE